MLDNSSLKISKNPHTTTPPPQSTANNKRIAKNTAFLYLRMFISMSVSLYTSRIVLQTLGVEDFGVYNVVGGVVAMFSFINATMSTATSRFLTFEIGKGNQKRLNDTFVASFWVHVIIAFIIVLLCETIGIWFIANKMVIPEGREFATQVVFQLSILAAIISITQVPYNATLIAHEKMDIYAYIEMVNVFLKLIIVYLLTISNFDKLIFYSILTLLVNTCVMMFYRFYGNRKFEECKISFKLQWDIIKPMLNFSCWDFYGNMSVTARTQGVAMLLNVFFGPVMNAAAAISAQVQTAVMAFASNVNTAVRPQIVKYYAQGEYKLMSRLINNACNLNFFVMTLIIVPLCSEINYILHLWLGEYPAMASTFCILTLLFNLFANLSFLVVTGIHAYGKIIRPSLINGSLYLLVVPISYLSFSYGGNAWTSYAFNVVAVILGLLSNVYTLHLYVNEYSISEFIKSVFIKCLSVLIIGAISAFLINYFFEETFFRFLASIVSTTSVVAVAGWFILLPNSIKSNILSKIKFICKRA